MKPFFIYTGVRVRGVKVVAVLLNRFQHRQIEVGVRSRTRNRISRNRGVEYYLDRVGVITVRSDTKGKGTTNRWSTCQWQVTKMDQSGTGTQHCVRVSISPTPDLPPLLLTLELRQWPGNEATAPAAHSTSGPQTLSRRRQHCS